MHSLRQEHSMMILLIKQKVLQIQARTSGRTLSSKTPSGNEDELKKDKGHAARVTKDKERRERTRGR